MDAVEYFEIKKRMTRNCSIECCKCDIDPVKHGEEQIGCIMFEMTYPKKAVEIAEKWDKEQPKKTRAQVFFEKFPDAVKCDDGTPTFCPVELGWGTNNDCTYNCIDCWSLPAPYKYQECGE